MSARWFLIPSVALLFLPLHGQLDDKPLPGDNAGAVTLYQACKRDDLATVKKLVGTGAPIDGHVGTLEITPLIAGAEYSHTDVVDFLIATKAKLDEADAQGSTALLHASHNQNSDMALDVINAGANVNLGSTFGRTPLMYAAKVGDDRVVQALIDHKVDLNTNCDQGPAICWAASNGHDSTVKLLASAGANPNLLPRNGRLSLYSALGCAAGGNDLEMVDTLIAAKADLNEAGHRRATRR